MRVVARERVRRLRQQHLAAVAGGHDPGRAMDVEARVVAPAEDRLAGVDAHPDTYLDARRPRVGRQRALARDRRPDRLADRREDREDRVALAGDQRPAMLCDRLAEQGEVIGEQLRERRPEVAHEARRAFDVGHEERDGSGGQGGHGRER